MKKVFRTSIAAVFLTAAANVYAHGPGEGYGMGPGMMGPGMMGWGYGMSWFWSIIMILFWIAAIVGVVLLVRWIVFSVDKGRGPQQQETAVDILKKRYARGEIAKEEYERMKKDIS